MVGFLKLLVSVADIGQLLLEIKLALSDLSACGLKELLAVLELETGLDQLLEESLVFSDLLDKPSMKMMVRGGPRRTDQQVKPQGGASLCGHHCHFLGAGDLRPCDEGYGLGFEGW